MATLSCHCGAAFATNALRCPNGHLRRRSYLTSGSVASSGGSEALAAPPPAVGSIPTATNGAPIAAEPDVSAVCTHVEAEGGAVTCPTCGAILQTRAAVAVVHFPWGDHQLHPGSELEVGRGFGPYQHELDAYRTVGRRHALIRCTARGQLLVIDEQSTNGTYRNGERIPPSVPIELRRGDTLRFSRGLIVTIGDA